MRALAGILVISLVVSERVTAGGEEDVTTVERYHWASTIVGRGYNQAEPRPQPIRERERARPPSALVDFSPDQPVLETLSPDALSPLLAAFRRDGVPLEEAWLRRAQGRLEAEKLTKAVVGRVLFAGTGVTKVTRIGGRPFAFRAAASAGALYPIEVYVATDEVAGLEAGLYRYDVQHHRLERLAVGPDAYAQVGGALSPKEKARRPAAYLVLTGVFDRTRVKYNVRGYRFVLLDAGHVAENLALESAARGLGVRLLVRFDDLALSQAVGVDGESEAPLVVLPLETTGSVQATPSPLAESPEPPQARGQSGLLSFQVHQASRLGAEELAALEEMSPVAEEGPAREELVELAQGADLGGTLEEAIAGRRSRRQYGRGTLSAAELARLLEWTAGPSRFPGLSPYVVVTGVEGVAAGVYRYWPKERALELVAPAPTARAVTDSALGQEFVSQGGCVVVLVADSSKLRGPGGARWYRSVHLAAGEAGERVYLVAEGLGLGTCAVGAFADGAVSQVLGLGEGQWPLLVYPVGRP